MSEKYVVERFDEFVNFYENVSIFSQLFYNFENINFEKKKTWRHNRETVS